MRNIADMFYNTSHLHLSPIHHLDTFQPRLMIASDDTTKSSSKPAPPNLATCNRKISSCSSTNTPPPKQKIALCASLPRDSKEDLSLVIDGSNATASESIGAKNQAMLKNQALLQARHDQQLDTVVYMASEAIFDHTYENIDKRESVIEKITIHKERL